MIPILCYHRVCRIEDRGPDSPSLCVSPEQFESQMHFLKVMGYGTVSVQDAAAALEGRKNLPPRCVALTFDDGYEDNFLRAFPVLKKYGFVATIFVVTDGIGKNNSWDSGSAALLKEEQIREMSRAGIIFGSHTASHLDLTQGSEDKIRDELTRSKQKVESLTSRRDTCFCYPYTRLVPRVKELVKECGYYCAVSGDPLNIVDKDDVYELPRVQVFPSTPLFGFWKKIQPWYPGWMRLLRQIKGDRS